MSSFLAAAAWILAAHAQPDVILLENQQVRFDGGLEVSEKQWNLKELVGSPLTDWSAYRFLIMELKASSPQRFQLTISTDQGVSPPYLHPFQAARIRAVVPLQMFMNPPRSGSTLSDVFNRQRVGYFLFHWGPFYGLNRVQAIGVAMPQPIGNPTLEIRTAYLSTHSPGDAILENGPLVDAMGQWIRDEWSNKVNTLGELQDAWNLFRIVTRPLESNVLNGGMILIY